ncbi:protein D2-like [Panonychus citri]|uniref:protein D2-like n=1 Tax=Panonychus citri TaxID=50023 RepID=UPI00230714D7|nr:protein D2-like [Panonychus citri]
MINIELVIVLILAITSSVQPISETCGNSTQNVEDAFRNGEIFKDLNLSPPSDGMGFIRVTYGNKQVSCGTFLSVTETMLPPSIDFVADSSKNYTFLMLDPDVPSSLSPLARSFVHWVIIDIPGDKIASGKEVKFYISPGPPPGSGAHRYVFLIYQQPDGNMEMGLVPLQRTNFNVSQYAKERNLSGPTAGNYFLETTTPSLNTTKSPIKLP